ncbi:hypothetical protein GGI07_004102 [Coemansia sp. Benny D115]|nr:hypothetical protein GGI07_004102 [Coemansia sp. Benny D115]
MSSSFGANEFQFHPHIPEATNDVDGQDKVICKDGRVFHACEICRKRRSRCDGTRPKCTSCQKRGLKCEYRAMRKRGRHGKKSAATADSVEPLHSTASATSAMDTSWSLGSPTPISARDVTAAESTLNLLGSLPKFLIPSGIPVPSSGPTSPVAPRIQRMPTQHRHSLVTAGPAISSNSNTTTATTTSSSILASTAPHPHAVATSTPDVLGSTPQHHPLNVITTMAAAAESANAGSQAMHTHHRRLLAAAAAIRSPDPMAQQRYSQTPHLPHTSAAALTSAFLESIDASQPVFLGSPTSPSLPPPPLSQPQTQQASAHPQSVPIPFRSLSVTSSVFESPGAVTIQPLQHTPVSAATSLTMVAAAAAAAAAAAGISSPIAGLGAMMPPAAVATTNNSAPVPFSPSHHHHHHQSLYHSQPALQRSMSASATMVPSAAAAAAAVAAAAVAAFQFSPTPQTPLPPPSLPPQPQPLPQPLPSSSSSSLADTSAHHISSQNNAHRDDEAGQAVAAALLASAAPRAAATAASATSARPTSARPVAQNQQQQQPNQNRNPNPNQGQGQNQNQNQDTNTSTNKQKQRQGPTAAHAHQSQRRRTAKWLPPCPAPEDAPSEAGGAPRRRRSGDWSRTGAEEDEVLDGLNAEGADSFGRPLFDVSTYPLPEAGELDEHMNGMFEYFYMGVQTLHGPTFRKRVASGSVSPVLIYSIMAIASRYSRRPSLHSLNGMAFLNGDRHASTACGLASIQLNHGDMGTVDTIHAMLFLSVYFMGQGNMLKSRMYLVKAVCTARTMGFQNMDATFVPSSPMLAFSGTFDRPHDIASLLPTSCSCPRTVEELVELETKRRIWWFLVFVDYFTANVMNVPLEIPPDSYCVRLPCSDEEWMSRTLSMGRPTAGLAAGGRAPAGTSAAMDASATSPSLGDFLQSYSPPLMAEGLERGMRMSIPRDLGFGDRAASAQQSAEYLRLNGFHDCRPPWLYHPGAFYLERLMIEFCDHLRRLNNLRALAIRSFFHVDPVFVDECYPYLKRRRQSATWVERLEKVKASWSWLHLQLNKWLDSILLRFSEVINRVPSDQYNRQYRHQYYYYLIAAHSTIIMSHGVILQLFTDFSRYIRQQQEQAQQFHNLQMQLYQQQQQQQQHQNMRSYSHTPMPGHMPFGSGGMGVGDPTSTLFGSGLSDARMHTAASAASAAASSAPPAWTSPGAHTPPVDYSNAGGLPLSDGLSEFAIGTLGSAMAPLMHMAQSLAANGSGGSSVHGSSIYGSVIGSPVCGSSMGMGVNVGGAMNMGMGMGMGMGIGGSGHHGHHQGGMHGMGGMGASSASAMGFDDLMGGGMDINGLGLGIGSMPPPTAASMASAATPASASATASMGGPLSVLTGPNAAINVLRDLSDMAMIAWDGCVSTAEQLASILRGKHPKFVLLGSPPLDVFREQVLSGDANILSQPGSAFNAPGTGPGADNPILSDPDFYMRLQPSTAWWMFLVAQVQVGHIKRLLKESEGCFKVSAKRKAFAAKAAAAKAAAEAAAKAAAAGTGTAPGGEGSSQTADCSSAAGAADREHPATTSAAAAAAVAATPATASSSTVAQIPDSSMDVDPPITPVAPVPLPGAPVSAATLDGDAEQLLGMGQPLQKPADQMRPLSTSVNNSAIMLATAVQLSNAAPAPPTRQAMEKRASIKVRASRLVRAYENLSCMVKVLEGMQQYWQCMDYVSVIQDILKGSEHPLH